MKGRKRAPVTLIKQWKEGKGQAGEGKQPLTREPMLDTCMLEESSDSVKLHDHLDLVPQVKSTWNLGTCTDLPYLFAYKPRP